MLQAETEVALQFSESCAAEVALQHSLLCSTFETFEFLFATFSLLWAGNPKVTFLLFFRYFEAFGASLCRTFGLSFSLWVGGGGKLTLIQHGYWEKLCSLYEVAKPPSCRRPLFRILSRDPVWLSAPKSHNRKR